MLRAALRPVARRVRVVAGRRLLSDITQAPQQPSTASKAKRSGKRRRSKAAGEKPSGLRAVASAGGLFTLLTGVRYINHALSDIDGELDVCVKELESVDDALFLKGARRLAKLDSASREQAMPLSAALLERGVLRIVTERVSKRSADGPVVLLAEEAAVLWSLAATRIGAQTVVEDETLLPLLWRAVQPEADSDTARNALLLLRRLLSSGGKLSALRVGGDEVDALASLIERAIAAEEGGTLHVALSLVAQLTRLHDNAAHFVRSARMLAAMEATLSEHTEQRLLGRQAGHALDAVLESALTLHDEGGLPMEADEWQKYNSRLQQLPVSPLGNSRSFYVLRSALNTFALGAVWALVRGRRHLPASATAAVQRTMARAGLATMTGVASAFLLVLDDVRQSLVSSALHTTAIGDAKATAAVVKAGEAAVAFTVLRSFPLAALPFVIVTLSEALLPRWEDPRLGGHNAFVSTIVALRDAVLADSSV
eukprot:PLAT1206.1.p1 GENE.PLAT1206.1~~PLAT1206.1.p1  ORF type:complete len:483 (+),score=175.35 PLAT1206.1:17-1465(+)